MERKIKAQLLKTLYFLKSIEYEYLDDVIIPIQNNQNILPFSDWEELLKNVSSCHLCDLAKNRKKVVLGEGNKKADIMFIGEAPGATEDELGRPFVGKAGEILTKIIENVLNLKRENVYIANIIKCRPPQNRVPTQEEANMCLPYLHKQIEFVNPKIIVALGSSAYLYLTGDASPITKVRGRIIDFKNAKMVPTYHPSYLLRNPSAKKEVFQDMLKVKGLL